MGRSGKTRLRKAVMGLVQGGDDSQGFGPRPGNRPLKARMRFAGSGPSIGGTHFGTRAKRPYPGTERQSLVGNELGGVPRVDGASLAKQGDLGIPVWGSELPPSEAEQRALAEWGYPCGSDGWLAWCIAQEQQQLWDCEAAHVTPQRALAEHVLISRARRAAPHRKPAPLPPPPAPSVARSSSTWSTPSRRRRPTPSWPAARPAPRSQKRRCGWSGRPA
eukprot:TRINITY_DN21411_c0_g1_i2.p1 TRINITY_DN21411_c0_g1~~TRINITY_DN21411_c0_g1_i2.p1  ORF type:complete len:219 (+),score=18.55 TRINITY_DN21411_c0_g1_i2:70-726(+)